MRLLLLLLLFYGVSHTHCNSLGCTDYILDLNVADGCDDLNGGDLILYNLSSYLVNIDTYNVTDVDSWDNISVAIMQNGDNGDEIIDLQIQQAISEGRLPVANSNPLITSVISQEFDTLAANFSLSTILGGSVYRGYLYTPDQNADHRDFVDATLRSLRYTHGNQYDFNPRNICIVVMTNKSEDVIACINVTFVGTNSQPPVLIYDGLPSNFTENQNTPTFVLSDKLSVTDRNHPMYLMESATVTILAAQEMYEVLSLNDSFDLVSAEYKPKDGQLNITGRATTDYYERIFESVIYDNSNDEPDEETQIRRIVFTLFDGQHNSIPLRANLLLINKNDVPTVVFSAQRIGVYYERNGSVTVDPGLYVIDADPMEMIQKVNITLYSEDGTYERISLPDDDQLNITINEEQDEIVIEGGATPTEYENLLRQLTYEHTNIQPGNPTEGNRTIRFFIEDEHSSKIVFFNFAVKPVNDPPELSFNNATLKSVHYTEDGPPLLIADDLALSDIDSNISMATLVFTELLNGPFDNFSVNSSLTNGLKVTITEYASNRTMIINGSATPEQYRKVLQSLTYVNLIQNNSITNGIRNITLQVTDIGGLSSSGITIMLAVRSRNDEPDVTIDEVLQFTEGSSSVYIIRLDLIKIIDEEMDNIASMNITLAATNGALDDGEFLFPQSASRLLNKATITDYSIYILCEGTVSEYEEVLRSIKYINEEDEPTYYANAATREKLQRVITIKLTDNNETSPSTAVHHILVNLTLVNDNAPNITLGLTDTSCEASRPGGSRPGINKRSARSVSSHQLKRLKVKRKGMTILNSGPLVEKAYSRSMTLLENVTCLSNITVTFNANTTTPSVSVRRDLQAILTLSPSELNLLPHYGKWLDRRTLTINFMGCYQWAQQDIHVAFLEQKNPCNVSTPCTAGVCFMNKTGCPYIGLQRVAYNITESLPFDNQTTLSPAAVNQGQHIISFFVLSIVIGSILIFMIILRVVQKHSSSKKDVPKVTNAKNGPETLKPISSNDAVEKSHKKITEKERVEKKTEEESAKKAKQTDDAQEAKKNEEHTISQPQKLSVENRKPVLHKNTSINPTSSISPDRGSTQCSKNQSSAKQ